MPIGFAEPMVPLRLLRSRTFSAANAAAFLHSGAIFSAAFLTTEYFQLGLGYGPLATGLRLLLWTATPMIVASLATGGPKSLINWLTDAVGNPIRDLGRYRDEWQQSFHFTFVEPAADHSELARQTTGFPWPERPWASMPPRPAPIELTARRLALLRSCHLGENSVLGGMNDMAFRCEHAMADAGGLARTDLPELNRSLRPIS